MKEINENITCIHHGILVKKNKFVAKWMTLEGMMLGEIRQKQKGKYRRLCFLRGRQNVSMYKTAQQK